MRVAVVVPLALLLVPAGLSARTVEVTVGLDPSQLAGTDPAGRPLLYAPNPVEPGSSISHWDVSALPDLLMEPSASSNLDYRQVDLTLALFEDLGWPRGTSNIVVQYTDPAGTGFFHPSLGNQRRAAFEAAVAAWAALLRSQIPINVEAGFDDLPCGSDGATLAQAGAQFIYADFPGAAFGGTWYPGALAESLSGQNLSLEDDPNPTAGELVATFNSAIDNSCLAPGSRFYYGLNASIPGGQIGFVNVALHELAHGLGFASYVDETNGQQILGMPDVYSTFLFDRTQNRSWAQMTNSQRVQSAVNTGNLVWSGSRVFQSAPAFLAAAPSLVVDSPSSAAGSLTVGTAAFGPPLTNPGVSGELVRAMPAQGCGNFSNASELNGRIAMIDRGVCNFVDKVANAQNAGARAVVMVNNVPGGPITMGGSDPSIVIPSVMISQADGAALDAVLATPANPGRLRLGQPQISVEEGAGSVQVAVLRDQGVDDAVEVTWTVAAQTATAADLSLGSGTVRFEDGQGGTRTFSITVVDDELSEDVETASITLSAPTGGASLGSPSTATLSIVDDDAPQAGTLAFEAETFRFPEGQGATTLGITRTGGTLGDVSVDVAVVGGTATPGVDFLFAPTTVLFADGVDATQIPLTILDDEDSEGGETIVLELTNATGDATVGGPSRATVTITDDEPCESSETVHCLRGSRFQVEVQWADFAGVTGVGSTAPLRSDDSGLFWFFSPNNWEVLIKVLDACAINERFWVFAAATTNVEYTLTVTDTATGEIREYTNPLGQQADALTDTDAFATCP